MQEHLNFTVTQIGHIHYRMSNPDWKIIRHKNEDIYTIAYAESGRAHYIIDGKETIISPGDLLFFQKGEAHTGWSDKEQPWRYFSIGFDLLCMDQETEHTLASAKSLYVSNDYLRCCELMRSIYRTWTARVPAYHLEVRRIILELLQELFCSRQADRLSGMQLLCINKAMQYINENPNQTHSISVLAKISGFSESYFSKLFRQHTGYSAITYQNLLRVTYAKDLIQTGDCNITEAAEATGFHDIYYFSRLYKKLLGESPSSATFQKSAL